MKQVNDFKKALYELFQANEDPDDAKIRAGTRDLLNCMDFYSLAQALRHNAVKVYQYRVDGTQRMKFEYRGPTLFPEATLLWEDRGSVTFDAADFYLSNELWLLPDLKFAVLSCLRVAVDDGIYVTEYRTYKGDDWADMHFNCPELARHLQEMVEQVWEHEIPVYEL